jgi:hypothetical protein
LGDQRYILILQSWCETTGFLNNQESDPCIIIISL